ncbi:MAG: hypothetical protein KAS72_10985 [Phycisphaerales bacterium]|nr:hypothetical protein [Phycisphaerales bacterium]
MGISKQTFCGSKKKFAGMGAAEVRQLKQLEEESRRLKQLVADVPVACTASASCNLAMICSGLCRLRFMIESLLAPQRGRGDSHNNWIRFQGAGQDDPQEPALPDRTP